MLWVYMSPTVSNTTDFVAISADPTKPNNIDTISASINGNMTLILIGSQCFIYLDTNTNKYFVAIPSPPSNSSNSTQSLFTYVEITNFVTLINLGNQPKWYISDSCDRFAANDKIFVRSPNQLQFSSVNNNMTLFAPTAFDKGLNAALVGSSIWLYNPVTRNFSLSFNSTRPFISGSTISMVGSQILVAGTSSSTAQAAAWFV